MKWENSQKKNLILFDKLCRKIMFAKGVKSHGITLGKLVHRHFRFTVVSYVRFFLKISKIHYYLCRLRTYRKIEGSFQNRELPT